MLENLPDLSSLQNKNSTNPEYYRKRGELHFDIVNVDMAISDYKTMIQMDPSDLNKWYFLIKAFSQYERLSEAIEGENMCF